jgi:ribosomal protein L32E
LADRDHYRASTKGRTQTKYRPTPKTLYRSPKITIFLPDGYEDMLVFTETLDEILTDKLVSLWAAKR